MNFDYLHFGGLLLEFGLHHHPSKSSGQEAPKFKFIFTVEKVGEDCNPTTVHTSMWKCMSVSHTGVASAWMLCSFIKFYQVGSFLSVISSVTGGTDHQLLGTTYKKGKDAAARFRYIH